MFSVLLFYGAAFFHVTLHFTQPPLERVSLWLFGYIINTSEGEGNIGGEGGGGQPSSSNDVLQSQRELHSSWHPLPNRSLIKH